MAQVKKLQQGGTLNINGKEYTVDQINEYLSSGQFSAQERDALSGTVRAIQEGKSRYLDANSNTLSGDGNVNEDFVDYFGSERRANRGRSGWNNRKQNRHANRNSDFAIRDTALAKLGNIGNYTTNEIAEPAAKNKLTQGSGWFYTNGKYVSGPQNLTNEKHIRDVFNYLASTEDGRKAWELSGWGDNMTGLLNWYNGQNVDEFLERIKANNLSDEDLEVLSFMGYSPTEQDIASTQLADDKTRFQKAGYDYDTWSGIIDIDENGNAIVRKGEDGKTAFSSLGGNGNYFFNDSFVQSNPKYDFLKNHFVIDGRVYKASDAAVEGSDLYNLLRAANGFYDKNKSGDWEGADQLIKHIWDGRKNYALGNNSDVYSQFLADNPNYRWTSITGAYDIPLAEGEQLIEYYDPSGNVNEFGYGNAQWAVLDKDGNFVKTINSRGNLTGNNPSSLIGKKIARTTSGNSTYDGLVIEDLIDEDGDYTNTTIFQDPNTGEFIYRGRIRGAKTDPNKDYVMPKVISDILSKPEYKRFWEKLKSDKKLQRQFERTLGDTINSGVRDLFTWNTMSKQNWMELGFSEEDAKTLVKEFDRYASNSEKNRRSIRRANRLINQVQINKTGGNIPMFQPGGAVGTITSKGHTEKQLNTNYQNADDFATIGDGEWEGLTGTDWAEIGALTADMVGLGLGLSGAPIASGVAGAVGSLTSFGADLSRDTNGDGRGFEWGDLGSLGINLGLDAISLIGLGAGAAAQSGKVAKAIQKSAKVVNKVFGNPKVIKSLSALGIGSAVTTSAQKIINGEEWTVRDIRNVMNGLTGVLTLRKTGMFQGTGTKGTKVQEGSVDVKIKGTDTVETVKLKQDVLDNVNKPNTKDVDIQLKKAIVAELNARPGARKVTVDDIDLTPAKVKIKRTWRHPVSGTPTDSYDFQVKEVTQPGELLHTKGPEATRRGVVDQFNNWLRTGEFIDLETQQFRGLTGEQARQLPTNKVWKGKPLEYGEDFRTWGLDYDVPNVKTDRTKEVIEAFKKSSNPFTMTSEQRKLLRRLQIFTPNFTGRNDDIVNQNQAHFVPIPVVVSAPGAKLSELTTLKTGGIIKAETGLKFKDWDPEKQQRYKAAYETARNTGQTSFEFDGQNYTISTTPIQQVTGPTELPDVLTKDIKSLGTSIGETLGDHKVQGEFSALSDVLQKHASGTIRSGSVNIPEYVEVNDDDIYATRWTPPTNDEIEGILGRMQGKSAEEIEAKRAYLSSLQGYNGPEGEIKEPSLRDQLIANGANAKSIRQVDRWTKQAARQSMKQMAGNTPADGTDTSSNLSDLFRAGKLANAFSADKYQQQMARNVRDSSMRNMASNPSEIYNRFQDYGVKEQYRQAADKLRKPIINVHSDVNSMYADQRARNNQATQLELEGNLKQSQLYSDWLDSQNELRRTYAKGRAEIENTNRQRVSAAENVYWTQMGASRAQRQQIVDNALTEQLGLYTQDREMNYKLADQNETLRYQYDMDALKSGYQKQLNDAITNGTMAAGSTLEDYFIANPTQKSAYTTSMKQLQTDALNRKMDNYKKYNKQSIFSNKKGGTVGNKRSASEQIWIDNQKQSAKAIEQLSKQAFEFLKMALS